MPYLKIQTNKALGEGARRDLVAKASKLVANALNKPERYMMVAMAPAEPMVFGGSDAACAYFELKSIGLSTGATDALSAALCELSETDLKIPRDRVYVVFNDVDAKMWGWNGKTF